MMLIEASEPVGRRGLPVVELSKDWIRETLSIYRAEHIAVEVASYRGQSTRLKIRSLPYPFTKAGHIEYMTASMAALYAAQAGYVHLRAAIEYGSDDDIRDVSSSDFFRCRDLGQIIFSRLSCKFHAKIPVGTLAELDFTHTQHRRTSTTLIGRFKYAIGEQAVVGDGTCFMVLHGG